MIGWLLNEVPWWVPVLGLFVAASLYPHKSGYRYVARDWWEES